jgi:polysaccharide biosynthesis transport protein
MTRLASKTREVKRSQPVDISAALEHMPLDELQKIVQNLKGDLEKAVRFVSEQEGELSLQRKIVADLEERLQQAGESVSFDLQLDLAHERERKEMLEATLIGQRRNLQKRETIFNEHWQVLRRRQGAFKSSDRKKQATTTIRPTVTKTKIEDETDFDDLDESTSSEPKKGALKQYLRIFKRKAWLIATVTGASTFLALLWSITEAQVYTGNFYLLVEPITSAGKLSDPSTIARTGGLPNEELFSLDYPTNLAFLQSPGMTSKIAQDVYNKKLDRSVPAIWQDLRENLIVQRIGEGRDATKIFEVTYQGNDPKEVIAILQTAADTFLKYSAEDRQTNIKAGLKFLDGQLPGIQQRLEKLRSQQQKLRQQYELVDPIVKSEETIKQISKVNEQLLSNQGQLDSNKKLYNVLQNQLQLTPQQALVASTLSQSPERVALLQQLQEINGQMAVESARFTNKSPQIQELEEKRQNVLSLLDRTTNKILAQNSLSVEKNSPVLNFQDSTRMKLIEQLVETANQIQMLEINNQSLKTAKITLEGEAKQLPAIANQYGSIERQIQLTDQILDKLLIQRETLKVEAAQELPWQLISKPQIPLNADGQAKGEAAGRNKKILAGAAGGLFLGMILAIWLEKRRGVFQTVDDLQDILSVPVIGNIPHDKRWAYSPNLALDVANPVHPEVPETAIASHLDDDFLSAFESLYAQISFLYSDRPIHSLAICSVEPDDGQSSIALHLAKTATRMGKRVLLVDANFYNPQLHDWLNLPNFKGLYHLLTESIAAYEVIQNVPGENNLFVLPSGLSQPNGSVRIWSSQMQHYMEEFRSKYDLVIYDAPKYLDTTDSSFLAAHTEGIVMVVSVDKTNQSLVKKAFERMDTFHLPILGVVANHTKQ